MLHAVYEKRSRDALLTLHIIFYSLEKFAIDHHLPLPFFMFTPKTGDD